MKSESESQSKSETNSESQSDTNYENKIIEELNDSLEIPTEEIAPQFNINKIEESLTYLEVFFF